MTEVKFQKGAFKSYRAIHDIRITLDKDPATIGKDDIVEYDGFTLKVDGVSYQVPTLKGAVQKGWFVSPEDTDSVYVAESAVKKLRPADMSKASSKEEGQVTVITIQDEEQVIGQIKGEKKNLRKTSKLEVQTVDSEDGVVVARMKNPSKTEFKMGDPQELQMQKRANEGSIHEIMVPSKQVVGYAGENLDDVFPDAASSRDHYPKAGEAGESKDVLLEKEAARKLAAERRKERILAVGGTVEDSENESWVGKAAVKQERQASEEETEIPQYIRTEVGIDWDLSPHWRKRAKLACERFGKSKEILESIIAVEQEGVVNFIREFMSREEVETETVSGFTGAKMADSVEEVAEALE